jgi:hypothetical protein
MIKGYTGMFGYGKTLWLVADVIDEMKKGRRVISNTPIRFKHKGQILEAQYVANRQEYMQYLITESNCIFVLDEAGIYLPNNYWDKMPFDLTAKLMQSRKYETDFYYTVQRFGHTTIKLRDLTNIIVKCYRKRFLGFGQIVFYAVDCDPEMVENKISINSPLAKEYILKVNKMYPSKYKKVFPTYDTKFKVVESLFVEGYKAT